MKIMADLHLIYTTHGKDGDWSLTSPQCPGYLVRRDTIDQLLSDTPRIVDTWGVPPHRHVWHHEQHGYVDPEGSGYLIRFVADPGYSNEERHDTAGRLKASIETGFDSAFKLHQPLLASGEQLLIAVHSADTIGWCLDQLATGNGAMLSEHRGEGAMYNLPILEDGDFGESRWSIETLGLTRVNSFAELFDRVMAQEAAELDYSPGGRGRVRMRL